MKKKWLLALVTALCVGTCAIGLAACGESEESGEHEHNYEQTWSHDASNHWHACTVEGCTQRSGTAPHYYGDDDICDVCQYERPETHEHTWEVNFDEAQHWQETTCTEHAPEKKDAATHSFDAQGVCECGVTQEYAEVYAVYKSYIQHTSGSLLSYKEWLADLEENNVIDVSINQAGDAVLHYAPEGDELEETEEVSYFAERTVTAKTIRGGITPYGPVWLKLTATIDGTTTTLATAQTTSQNNFEPTFTFTPTAYTSDTVSYAIEVMEDAEVPQTPGFPTVHAYPESAQLLNDKKVTFEVSEFSYEETCVATFNFAEALSVGHDVQNLEIIYEVGNADWYYQLPVNVEPGGYLVKLTMADDCAATWRTVDDTFGVTSSVPSLKFNPYWTENPQNNTVEYAVDAENPKIAYIYVYLSEDVLAKSGRTFSFYNSRATAIKFSIHIEPYTAPVLEEGVYTEVPLMPVLSMERYLGIDISHLKAGQYYLTYGAANECHAPRFNNDQYYGQWDYAVDKSGYSGKFTTGTGILSIGEGAKYLYLRGATKSEAKSNTYDTIRDGARIVTVQLVPVTAFDGDEDVTLYDGIAHLRYTIPNETNTAYEVTLSASTPLRGISLTTSKSTISLFQTSSLPETATTVRAVIWLNKTTPVATEDFNIDASGVDTLPEDLHVTIKAVQSVTDLAGTTEVTFSGDEHIKLYTFTADQGVLEMRGVGLENVAVYYSYTTSTSTTSSNLLGYSDAPRSAYTYNFSSSATYTLAFVCLDEGTYPTVSLRLIAAATATPLQEGQHYKIELGGSNAETIAFYEFTTPRDGETYYYYLANLQDGGFNGKVTFKIGASQQSLGATYMETYSNLTNSIRNGKVTFMFAAATEEAISLEFVVFGANADITEFGKAEQQINLGIAGESHPIALYKYTPEKTGEHLFEMTDITEEELSHLEVTHLKDFTSTAVITMYKASGDKAYGFISLNEGVPVYFAVMLKSNNDYSSTISPSFKMKVILPEEGGALVSGTPTSVTFDGASYKYFHFTASAGNTFFEFKAEDGKTLENFYAYCNTTSVLYNIKTETSSKTVALNAGDTCSLLVVRGATESESISVTLKDASAGALDLSKGPQKATVGPENLTQLFVYKNLKAGFYFIEIDVGGTDLSLANFKKFSFTDGTNTVLSTTSKTGTTYALRYFYENETTANLKNGYAFYRNRLTEDGDVVVGISYNTATAAREFTVSLHSAQTAKDMTGETTVAFGGDAPHFAVYKITTEEDGIKTFTIDADKPEDLQGFTASTASSSLSGPQRSQYFSSKLSAPSDAASYTSFGKPMDFSAGSMTLFFEYQKAAEKAVELKLNTVAPESPETLNVESGTTVTMNEQTYIKYFTYTPTLTTQYKDIQVKAAMPQSLGWLRLYVSPKSPDYSTQDWFTVDTKMSEVESRVMTQTRTLEAGVEYTFCFVWCGAGDITFTLEFTPTLDVVGRADPYNDLAINGNIIYWKPVYGATHYLIERKKGSSGDEVQAEQIAEVAAEDCKQIRKNANDSNAYLCYDELPAMINDGDGTSTYYYYSITAERKEGEEVMKSEPSAYKGVSATATAYATYTLTVNLPELPDTVRSFTVSFSGGGTGYTRHYSVQPGKTSYTVILGTGASDKKVFDATSTYTVKVTAITGSNSSALNGYAFSTLDPVSFTEEDHEKSGTITVTTQEEYTYVVKVVAPEGFAGTVSFKLTGGGINQSGSCRFTGNENGEPVSYEYTSYTKTTLTVSSIKLENLTNNSDSLNDIDTSGTLTLTPESTEPVEITLQFKELVKHTVTIELPENYAGDTGLTVAVRLQGTSTDLISTKLPANEAGAKTATYEFDAAWGRNYSITLSGFVSGSGYSAKNAPVLTASKGGTATGTLTVNQRGAYTVTVEYPEEFEGDFIIELWAAGGSRAAQSKQLTASGTSASHTFYAAVGSYTVKVKGAGLNQYWVGATEPTITADPTSGVGTASVTLTKPNSVTVTVHLPAAFAPSYASGATFYYAWYSESNEKLGSGSVAMTGGATELYIIIATKVGDSQKFYVGLDDTCLQYNTSHSIVTDIDWFGYTVGKTELVTPSAEGTAASLTVNDRVTVFVKVNVPAGYTGSDVPIWLETEDGSHSWSLISPISLEREEQESGCAKWTEVYAPATGKVKIMVKCHNSTYDLQAGFVSSVATLENLGSFADIQRAEVTITAAPAAD